MVILLVSKIQAQKRLEVLDSETFPHVLHGKQYDKRVQGGSLHIIPGTKSVVCDVVKGRENNIQSMHIVYFAEIVSKILNVSQALNTGSIETVSPAQHFL